MSEQTTSFILAYHGCDQAVAESLLAGRPFRVSANDYDWLGSGIYFWQSNPRRGLDWALELKGRGKLQTPAVVGAAISLRNCLDLVSTTGIRTVQVAYESLKRYTMAVGQPMRWNVQGPDLLMRYLDCAVVNHLHELLAKQGSPAFDTVRAVFTEGKEIYPTSGFREKTHMQICVRTPDCIKGVFRVSEEQLDR